MVYTESLLQDGVRHNRSLEKTDLVLVYCGGMHFVGAGQCLFIPRGSDVLPQRSIWLPQR